MNKLISYSFEVNAAYTKEALYVDNIESKIENTEGKFLIYVAEENFEKAKSIIQKLDLDETPLNPNSKDYLEGHFEYSQKMYDPGHYTGGKIPHFYLDKSNYMMFAIYFGGFGLILLLMIWAENPFNFTDLWLPITYLIVGISLRYQYLRYKKKK